MDKTSQLVLQHHDGLGGTSYDTRNLSSYFDYDKPTDFGRLEAQIFTASNRFKNKPLTSFTAAAGNIKEVTSNRYRWSIRGDDRRLFRVVALLESGNTRPGYANQTFRIVLDRGWLKEPDVISPEDVEFPIEILGQPERVGEYEFIYTCRMLSSNPAAFIPAQYIAVGKTFTKTMTTVPDEMNYKGGSGQMGSHIELESQIGFFAEERSITDKVVRREIQAYKNGTQRAAKSNGQPGGYEFSRGYLVPLTLTKDGQEIKRGAFIPFLEADVLEEINMSIELAMQYGKQSTRTDGYNHAIKTTGPGFRELVVDGHRRFHNGYLTVKMLKDYFYEIFLARVDEGERDIMVSTGTLGAEFFNEMLSEEHSSFLTVDTHFTRKMAGGEEWELEFGAQFKSFRSTNGLRVRLVMDPLKDDRLIHRRPHPDNPIFTVESARMDIWDFGQNTSSESNTGSNMFMVVEPAQESYFWVSPLVDPYNGIEKSGARVASMEKGCKIFREKSGGLCVCDTDRIGSLIYEPGYAGV